MDLTNHNYSDEVTRLLEQSKRMARHAEIWWTVAAVCFALSAVLHGVALYMRYHAVEKKPAESVESVILEPGRD